MLILEIVSEIEYQYHHRNNNEKKLVTILAVMGWGFAFPFFRQKLSVLLTLCLQKYLSVKGNKFYTINRNVLPKKISTFLAYLLLKNFLGTPASRAGADPYACIV